MLLADLMGAGKSSLGVRGQGGDTADILFLCRYSGLGCSFSLLSPHLVTPQDLEPEPEKHTPALLHPPQPMLRTPFVHKAITGLLRAGHCLSQPLPSLHVAAHSTELLRGTDPACHVLFQRDWEIRKKNTMKPSGMEKVKWKKTKEKTQGRMGVWLWRISLAEWALTV